MSYNAILLSYAAGALDDAQRLVVDAHLALQPDKQPLIACYEDVGGALLDGCAPCHMSDSALDSVLSRLDDMGEPERPITSIPHKSLSNQVIPPILTRHMGCEAHELSWRSVWPGMRAASHIFAGCTQEADFLKISPGVQTPKHKHAGLELTLILEGAFSDDAGEYARGDLVVHDTESEHQPVACPEMGCFCVSVSAAPPQFTGILGRVLNLFQ